MDPNPVAASAALAPVLLGPSRPVSVVASLPGALYLRTGDPACPAICVAAATAVRVPCAAVLRVGEVPPRLEGGTPAVAGAGGIDLPGRSLRVRRWWNPPRPRLPGAGAAATPPGAAPAGWSPAGRAAVRPAAFESPGADLPDVDALLGAGPGLTPYGDDVLAGALVTLAALGLAAPLAERVLARAFERTTFVSAALLVHAARGECVPQLAAVLRAVAAGAPAAEPIAALLRVGHTSGRGLLDGVRAVLPGVGR